MNDFDQVLKQIDQLTTPIRQVDNTFNKVLLPYIQGLTVALEPMVQRLHERIRTYEPFFIQINTTLTEVAEASQKWQAARKEDVVDMADNGWYPNWYTFFYYPKIPISSLDELMERHLEENWDEITAEMLKYCSNRKHILENAFGLHKQGNYIASIPLFYSQADGICCEVLKRFLFTGDTTQAKFNELIEKGEIDVNMLTDIFLAPFKLKNHHNAGISKSSIAAKCKAPNRNGILHGHRKHLDYGTKKNSLKVFSLLSFIVFTVKDLINET